MKTLKKYNRFWLIIALPILVVICTLIATWIVNSMDYHHKDNDFFTFWLAGHLVTQGESPYDTAQWVAGYQQFQMDIIPNPAFLYPLPLALFFAPIGLMPFHTAYVTWVLLLELLILASLAAILIIQTSSRAILFCIPLLVGIIFFRPTTLTLTQGQVSGLILFVIVGMAWLWQKGEWFWGGILLGLLVLKPNLGFIIIALLALWLFFQKHWTALLGTLLSGIFLFATGMLYNPHWVIEYWQVSSHKLAQTFGESPTVWGLSALFIHNSPAGMLTLGGLGALLVLLWFFVAVFRAVPTRKPLTIIALAITVTLLVTPYTWTYDQLLLLIPITGITFAMDQAGYRFSITAVIFLIIDLFAFLLLIPNSILGIEILNAIIPLTILGFCIWWIKTLPSR